MHGCFYQIMLAHVSAHITQHNEIRLLARKYASLRNILATSYSNTNVFTHTFTSAFSFPTLRHTEYVCSGSVWPCYCCCIFRASLYSSFLFILRYTEFVFNGSVWPCYCCCIFMHSFYSTFANCGCIFFFTRFAALGSFSTTLCSHVIVVVHYASIIFSFAQIQTH